MSRSSPLSIETRVPSSLYACLHLLAAISGAIWVLIAIPEQASATYDPERICSQGLRVGIAGDFPPYLILKGNTAVGIEVDVSRLIFRSICPGEAEDKIILVDFKPAEVLDRLKEAEVDVAIASISTETVGRKHPELSVSYPYIRGGLGMAVRIGSQEDRILTEISGKLIPGTLPDRFPAILFEKLIEQLPHVEVAYEKDSAGERLFKLIKEDLTEIGKDPDRLVAVTDSPDKLFDRSANVVINDDIFLAEKIGRSEEKDWKLLQLQDGKRLLIHRGDVIVAVRKKDSRLLDKVNSAIVRLWGATDAENNLNVTNWKDLAQRMVHEEKALRQPGVRLGEPLSPCSRMWQTKKVTASLLGYYNIFRLQEEQNRFTELRYNPKMSLDFEVKDCPAFDFLGAFLKVQEVGLVGGYANIKKDNSAILGKQLLETAEVQTSFKFVPFPIIEVIPMVTVGIGYLIKGTQEFDVGTPEPPTKRGALILSYSLGAQKNLTESVGVNFEYQSRSSTFPKANLDETFVFGLTIKISDLLE